MYEWRVRCGNGGAAVHSASTRWTSAGSPRRNRTTIPCIEVGDLCYPWWTDTDCNLQIDVKDALWIVADLADAPVEHVECPAVGSYPVG